MALDARFRRQTLISMNRRRNQTRRLLPRSDCLAPLSFLAAFFSCLPLSLLATAMQAATAGAQLPILEFIEPTNNAVFSTLDEIPIVLRASGSQRFDPGRRPAPGDAAATNVAGVDECSRGNPSAHGASQG
jgi:hypothetical protein